jgi:hypothetical protein
MGRSNEREHIRWRFIGKWLKIVTKDIACAKLGLLETACGFECWWGLKGCNFGRLKVQSVVKWGKPVGEEKVGILTKQTYSVFMCVPCTLYIVFISINNVQYMYIYNYFIYSIISRLYIETDMLKTIVIFHNFTNISKLHRHCLQKIMNSDLFCVTFETLTNFKH